MASVLTFIVLACSINVSVADENTPGCKVFKEEVFAESSQGVVVNPMACMMASPEKLVEFHEKHPGLMIRRWTCKYLKEEKDI